MSRRKRVSQTSAHGAEPPVATAASGESYSPSSASRLLERRRRRRVRLRLGAQPVGVALDVRLDERHHAAERVEDRRGGVRRVEEGGARLAALARLDALPRGDDRPEHARAAAASTSDADAARSRSAVGAVWGGRRAIAPSTPEPFRGVDASRRGVDSRLASFRKRLASRRSAGSSTTSDAKRSACARRRPTRGSACSPRATPRAARARRGPRRAPCRRAPRAPSAPCARAAGRAPRRRARGAAC